jgi:hypothetical protein
MYRMLVTKWATTERHDTGRPWTLVDGSHSSGEKQVQVTAP